MRREEMSREDAVRIVAGSVRNNVGTATVFSPYVGLQLAYRDGMLCRVSPEGVTTLVVMTQEEVHECSDEEIYMLVEGAV